MKTLYANERKLDRAIMELKRNGVSNPTDAQIREEYLKYGGRITGDRSTERGTDDGALIHLVEAEVVQPEVAEEVEEPEAPVRRGRRRA